MATTQDVLENHLKCFGEGNLEGILSDYAPGVPVHTGRATQRARSDQVAVHGDACRVWEARRRLQHEGAVCRGRLCLHPLDGRDR